MPSKKSSNRVPERDCTSKIKIALPSKGGCAQTPGPPSFTARARAPKTTRNERAYMLMDFVDGPNLTSYAGICRSSALRLQVMTIMPPIVDAISYPHSQQPPIIHPRLSSPVISSCPIQTRPLFWSISGIAKEFDRSDYKPPFVVAPWLWRTWNAADAAPVNFNSISTV